MKTHGSQEPPPVSAWMEDALAMMELSAEVTAGLSAPAGNDEPEAAREEKPQPKNVIVTPGADLS